MAICVKDLRVGNLVNLFLGMDDNCAQYRQCHIKGVMTDLVGSSHYLIGNTWIEISNNLEPIPLTDKWLIKFGFLNGGYDLLFWYLKDFELAGNDFLNEGEDEPEYAFNYYIDNTHKQILIKYVHQLQNLFFVLSGEELEIKEVKA